jgi:hypothetical protein
LEVGAIDAGGADTNQDFIGFRIRAGDVLDFQPVGGDDGGFHEEPPASSGRYYLR